MEPLKEYTPPHSGASYSFTVGQEHAGLRLDAVLPALLMAAGVEVSRSYLKTEGVEICLNGRPEKLSCRVKSGDAVSVSLPQVKPSVIAPRDLPVEIIYRDDDIAVVNKPYGMTVHPATGHTDDTLVNALLFHMKGRLSGIGGVERPGIVHRLDRDTAGLMVIALHDLAHQRLAAAFHDRMVDKTYEAVVKGRLIPETGRIENNIGRSTKDRKKMAVCRDGKHALTEYRVLEYLQGHTYVEVHIHTGRTHQIRVHMAYLGHPIAADPIYSRGAPDYNMTGIALCARRLAFRHPMTDQPLNFEIPLPGEMADLIKRLRVS